MREQKIALVTGATGAVGPPLVRQLIAHGYAVRTLARVRPRQDQLPEGVDFRQGSITDAALLAAAMRDVTDVFHLAARLHTNDPSPALREEYTRVNVDGTRYIVEAAGHAGVRRIVFASTINVYGASTRGEVLNEQSPLRPESLYAETKARAEELVAASDCGVVLRLAAVYGPGMKGNYARLLSALQRRRFIWLGDGANRRTLVHVDDAAAAFHLAAENPRALGRIYNVTDGQVHTLREVVEAMSAAAHVSPPRLTLPVAPVRQVAGLFERGCRLLGLRPLPTRSMLDKFLEDVAVSGDRLQQELGFTPQYDLRAGWRQTAKERAI